MKHLLMVSALLLSLTGCGEVNPNTIVTDQCARNQVFMQCMSVLPAGPVTTQYNDWDEVVTACDSVAYYQSLRKAAFVKSACRS